MKTCEQCQKEFYVVPSRHMAKFCSNACRAEASRVYLRTPRKAEKEKKSWLEKKAEIEETQKNVKGILAYDEASVTF